MYTSEQSEGIVKKEGENILMAYEYAREELKPGVTYNLLIEAYPSVNLPEGSLEMIILSKQSGA